MTPQGNMNPRFSEVDIVPDDDLNTKLKFHVRNIPMLNFNYMFENIRLGYFYLNLNSLIYK